MMSFLHTFALFCGVSIIAIGAQMSKDPEKHACALISCESMGKEGPPGKNGLSGAKGEKGEQGLQGLRGPEGPQGTPGLMGPKGEQGVQGPKGDRGESSASAVEALKLQISLLDGRLSSLQSRLETQRKAFLYSGVIASAGNKIYVTNGKQTDYNTAENECRHIGGTLPIPVNDEETNAIFNLVRARQRNAYLGINDIKNEGTFMDVYGRNVYYTKWLPHEPNNEGNEDCTELTVEGGWNDTKCHYHYLVVCEF